MIGCADTAGWDWGRFHECIINACVFIIDCHRLGLDYVDLYLMHSAMGGKVLETWDAMVELKKKGLVRYEIPTQRV